MNKVNSLRISSGVMLSLLAMLCIAWEWFLAPVTSGGSALVLKGAILFLPMAGIWLGRRYTYQWFSMFVLLYWIEGFLRMNDLGLVSWLARLELLISIPLFFTVIYYAKLTRSAVGKPGQQE